MNRKVVTIIVAVLLAVLGTTAVLFYVNRADARAMEGKEAVTVLVAAEPIPAGTKAGAAQDLLRAENMPAASVPSDALHAIDKSQQNLVTSTNLQPGQLLTRAMLVKPSAQDDVVLPAGKLAVTIPIKEGSKEEGPIAGMKVAVFNTFTVGSTSNGFTPSGERLVFGVDKDQATRLLLAKVDVISVVAEKAKKDDGFGKLLVTVAVTQPEAERLIHALNTGTVSLAQVNDGSKVAPSAGVDNNRLFRTGS